MKIGYFADGPWSHRALEIITNDPRFQIVFIVPRYDTQDPVLKSWAERLEVDYLPISNVNSLESINKLRAYDADLFVSMSFNQILKTATLEAAPLGFINCHAGALPFYKGRNILNWVLINDAKEFGVTVHYVDEGIDTGDIIVQACESITDQDDYATLLERAIGLCATLLYRAVSEIADGKVKRIPQSRIGFYCGRRVDGDEWIDWDWSSRRIFNFVRALTTPGPCARTIVKGQVLFVRQAAIIENAPNYIGCPGEIVGKKENNLIVKTGDSTIMIRGWNFSPSVNKVPPIRIGQRFGINTNAILNDLVLRVSELEQRLT